MTDDNMQNKVEVTKENYIPHEQSENDNIEPNVVKKKKNKILLAYVYFTFAIALIVMLITVSVNMPVINKEMLDRDYIDGLFVMFVAWVSTAGIPLVNLVILAIATGTTKVAYKIEMLIAIILAILEVPTFFMAISFVVFF